LGGEIGGVSFFDDEDEFAAALDERDVDAGLDVAVAGIAAGVFHDLIFVGGPGGDVDVDVARRRAGELSARTPRRGTGDFAVDGVTGRSRSRVLRPGEGDLSGRGLDRRADLHGVIPRGLDGAADLRGEHENNRDDDGANA